LISRIGNDIGSGNEGDMLDMQCKINQDPLVNPLMKAKESTLESVSISREETLLSEESLRKEDLSTSRRINNPEEDDEIEMLFKTLE
jgi:hypothetical protein